MKLKLPSEWEIALSAQSEILAWMTSDSGVKYRNAWLSDRNRVYGLRAMSPSAAALTQVVPDLIVQEPLFVTKEMQHLTYHAMETFNRKEAIVEEDDFFLKSGFAYLEEPFMSIDASKKRLAWRAISWRLDWMWVSDEEMLTEEIFAINMKVLRDQPLTARERAVVEHLRREQVARIVLWSNFNDKDDYEPSREDWHFLQTQGIGRDWGIAHATAVPLSSLNHMREITGEGDQLASWLTFLRVMNRLMSQQIVSRTRYQAPRPLRREMLRRNKVNINDVVVVELRRKTHKTISDEKGTANYSHRFIRHGHWRNQWYPSLKMHRQKYIEDMVVGPEDKPLIIKKRVWVWDR
jgi:hypothetical protein